MRTAKQIAEASVGRSLADELADRNLCCDGLKGVQVQLPASGLPDLFTISECHWHHGLLLLMQGGTFAKPSEAIIATPWPVVCECPLEAERERQQW